MKKLIHNAAQVLTVDTSGKNFKRGAELADIKVLTEHSIIIENGLIKDIIPLSSIKNTSDYEVIDIEGKVILPGLVECHTHTAFAGSRADEFRQKVAGATYEEIAASGGGIINTVRAVRNSTAEELVQLMGPRVANFISQGVTTLEIKSGYGLNFENEVKLLNAIKAIKKLYPINIVSTFLGAHTYPSEYRNNHNGYLNELTNKMIPYICKNELAEFCDAFCESTAFSSSEVDEIFSAAVSNGMKIKLHTEQFNNIGGLDTALKHNAVSVDHLEVLNDADLEKLSSLETVSVLLPGVSFFLNYQYAPARKLIDQGAIVALATDYNPGSSHISSISLIMSLATIKMKMKIEECLSAYTINSAAALLKSHDRGSIEINKRADFAVFNTSDYSDIVYNVGKNLNYLTIKDGNIIYKNI